MDEWKDLVRRTRVPDPGPEYWEGLPSRVLRQLPAAELRFRTRTVLWPMAAAAAAGLAMVLTLLPWGGPAPAPPAPPVPRPVLAEARRTARLAGDLDPGDVLGILGAAAREKADRAQAALKAGRDEELTPLVRSWEKILAGGILKRIEKAAEDDEPLGESLVRLRDLIGEGRRDFRLLAQQATDPQTRGLLREAVAAADVLMDRLDAPDGAGRG